MIVGDGNYIATIISDDSGKLKWEKTTKKINLNEYILNPKERKEIYDKGLGNET